MLAILTINFILTTGNQLSVSAPVGESACIEIVRQLQEGGQGVEARCEFIKLPEPAKAPEPEGHQIG